MIILGILIQYRVLIAGKNYEPPKQNNAFIVALIGTKPNKLLPESSDNKYVFGFAQPKFKDLVQGA